MAEVVGRYVFVVDRVEIIEERRRQLAPLFEEYGTDPVVAIRTANSIGKGGVGRQIADDGLELSGNHHTILFITHAGMKLVKDWSNFALWDAIIVDEIPSILDRGEHKASVWDRPALELFYELAPTIVEGISEIAFKGGLPRDQVPAEWENFHQRVMRGDAYCDLTSWSDLLDQDQGDWSSWWIWDVTKLAHFNDVYFLGDSFADTDTYHLMRLDPSISFVPFTVRTDRAWQPREVVVRYVSEDRNASKTLFTDDGFAPGLVKIGAWLSLAGTDRHLWSCNNSTASFGEVIGKKVSPKQAGTNDYIDWHKASMIYAAKPSPAERRFFALLDISPEVIIASRESYDINQFFMRTSLRLPDSVEPLEFRVFDKRQAQTFADKMFASYGIDAELEFDDIELIVPEKKMGRPAKNGQRAMTQDERRAADTARKRAKRLTLKAA
jgi:hypothetical protein